MLFQTLNIQIQRSKFFVADVTRWLVNVTKNHSVRGVDIKQWYVVNPVLFVTIKSPHTTSQKRPTLLNEVGRLGNCPFRVAESTMIENKTSNAFSLREPPPAVHLGCFPTMTKQLSIKRPRQHRQHQPADRVYDPNAKEGKGILPITR